ncbi:hypothetical protein GCM10010232_01560 [Streptomyces amakusaensis]|uniref:Calcium-binding protein n=1 Tax=Streptomyces amakusaensis TaxID=67271 RepID=A0ABW0AU44_9ACTN
MRFRISAAVVTGAVVLTGLSAPAVQADEKPAGFSKGFAAKPQGDVSTGDIKISDVSLNGGKPVIVGTTKEKKVTLTFKAIDNSGVKASFAYLWRGTDPEDPQGFFFADSGGEDVKCSGSGKKTKATCKVTFTIDPSFDLSNTDAGGGWRVMAAAQANDGNVRAMYKAKSFNLNRGSQISINAAPEPVKKGKDLTVTGSLTRADWESGKYIGYTKQPVKLQFRKKGAKTFTTVKTVRTGDSRVLSTTVKATVDGTYRYSFEGNSTTAPVTNGGDFVDVN